MHSLSIRTRIVLLIVLFSLISVSLSALSISSLSSVREALDDIVQVKVETQRLAVTISRDFEALNAEQNGLAAAVDADEVAQRIAEQDRLYKAVDESLAAIDKLVTADERAQVDQFKAQLEEYRRVDAQFRKLVTSRESDRAIQRHLGDGAKLVSRIRDVLRKGVEVLDRGKGAQTAALARDLLITFLSINDGLGDMVLDITDTGMEELSRSNAALLQQLAGQLEALREADSEGQRLAQRVGPLLDDYRRLHGEIERDTRTNTRVRAVAMAAKSDAHVRLARESIRQLVARTDAELHATRQDTERLATNARTAQIVLSLLGIAAGGLFALFTVLRVQRGVEAARRVSAEVADSSAQLRQATQSIAQRATEEASSLEETSATMEQMSATVEQNRASAMKARELAEKAREAAAQGATVTAQAADSMRSLNDTSSRIAEISETVGELAFQTNILALNASVEAARAGEHGRGFTVVAAEVRALAQRSAVAAKEISSLIKDSLQRIQRGVELVGRSSAEMERIVEGTEEATTLVASISAAAQEQATGIVQVSQAVVELNQVVQANSAQTEEMAATAENLDQQSQELLRAVATISGTADELARQGRPGEPAAPRPLVGSPRGGGGIRNGAPATSLPDPLHAAPRAEEFRNF